MSLHPNQILLNPYDTYMHPRPLASVDLVKGLLDIEEPKVLAMLECGDLMFGFDLHTPGARQPCLRIYLPCLVAFVQHQAQPDDLEAVIQDILPKTRSSVVRARSLLRCFNVTPSMVHGLVNHGAFKVVQPARRGCCGCALLERASVEDFLRARRYC